MAQQTTAGPDGFREELRTLKTWRSRLAVALFGLLLGVIYALIGRL